MFEHLPVYSIALAALCCWLVAGVFFAFSDFVMKSLNALLVALMTLAAIEIA